MIFKYKRAEAVYAANMSNLTGQCSPIGGGPHKRASTWT